MAEEVYGTGLPYAPENWPQQGDVWGWKTGRRVVTNGKHFQDRYMYLLDRLFWLLKKRRRYQGQGHVKKSSASNTSSRASLLLKAISIHIFLTPIMKSFYLLSLGGFQLH